MSIQTPRMETSGKIIAAKADLLCETARQYAYAAASLSDLLLAALDYARAVESRKETR
jgi:hypothetical protein